MFSQLHCTVEKIKYFFWKIILCYIVITILIYIFTNRDTLRISDGKIMFFFIKIQFEIILILKYTYNRFFKSDILKEKPASNFCKITQLIKIC